MGARLRASLDRGGRGGRNGNDGTVRRSLPLSVPLHGYQPRRDRVESECLESLWITKGRTTTGSRRLDRGPRARQNDGQCSSACWERGAFHRGPDQPSLFVLNNPVLNSAKLGAFRPRSLS